MQNDLLIPRLASLQLGLLRRCQQTRHHHISDITSSFVEEETHPITAEMFRDDVELDTTSMLAIMRPVGACERNAPVLVNHIRDAPPCINDLTPTISIEIL
jgi:hypothetical protein